MNNSSTLVSRKAAQIRLSGHPDKEHVDSDKLTLLPATAEVFYEDKLKIFQWIGTLDGDAIGEDLR